MGLLEQEIKELRKLNKDFSMGKVSTEALNGHIAVYAQIEKRAKLVLQAHALAAKHGKRAYSRIAQTNLIGDGSCIDVEDTNNETVFCPDQDRQITRQECLDFSGDSRHCSDCESCEHFGQTRNLLMGKLQ